MVDAVLLLKIWLGIVAGFRTLSVVLGYAVPGLLLGKVFSPVEDASLQAIELINDKKTGEDSESTQTKSLMDAVSALKRGKIRIGAAAPTKCCLPHTPHWLCADHTRFAQSVYCWQGCLPYGLQSRVSFASYRFCTLIAFRFWLQLSDLSSPLLRFSESSSRFSEI